jgi:rhodanese-related sulfurtransferase
MKPTQLRDLIATQSQKLLILDVREREEFDAEPLLDDYPVYYKNLPLTLLSVVPKEELLAKIEGLCAELEGDHAHMNIITSCRSGVRSAKAVEVLGQHGIAAESLEGGVLGFY